MKMASPKRQHCTGLSNQLVCIILMSVGLVAGKIHSSSFVGLNHYNEISSGLGEISQSLLSASPDGLGHGGLVSNVNAAISNVSLSCLASMAKSSSLSKITALDASGKPTSGILGETFYWLGNMDECVAMDSFHHCAADMQLDIALTNDTKLKEPITWGICMPKECSENDIKSLITSVLEQLSIDWFHINPGKAADPVHCAEFPPKPYNNGFICVVSMFSIIGVLMLLGSALDVYIESSKKNSSLANGNQPKDEERAPLLQNQRYGANNSNGDQQREPADKQSIIRTFLLCFAFNRSLGKILATKKSDKNIGCLNGIRVISMFWIILAHTLLYLFQNLYFDNMNSGAIANITAWHFTVVLQAALAVDSFFFLSGFLLAYLALEKMATTDGKLPWGMFYVHRFLRLTPVYGSVILFLLFIDPYVSNGPLWYQYVEHPSCQKYWWRNLLYISNLFPKEDMCMDWSWYLPNDMQFFAISPVLVILLFRRPKIGIAVLSTLTAMSIVTRLALSTIYPSTTLDIGAGSGTDGKPGFWDAVYDKPYTRIPPYLVGLALGFFMERYRHIRMHRILVISGWLLASAAGLINVYIFNDSVNRGWTKTGSTFYSSLSPFIWALTLCWVVLACKNGYGGWINTFLSWSVWLPLGRLTYTVYLIHPIIIRNIYYASHYPYHVSYLDVSTLWVSNVVLCHGVALLFTLTIEFPFANLEKMLFSSFEKKENRRTSGKD